MAKRTHNRRVAIFFPDGRLETVPCARNTAVLLARNDYEVDIFTIKDERYPQPRFSEPQIRVFTLSPKRARGRFPGISSFASFTPWAARQCRDKRYKCIIGVAQQPLELVSAAFASRLLGVPLVYYSIELYLLDDIRSLFQRLNAQWRKALERWCNRRASFTIIQDDERARLLAAANGISISQIITVPNSPLGRAARQDSDYLREKFQIPKERKIILHAGGLADWTMSLELAEATRTWSGDWVLIFHTREAQNGDAYLDKVRAAADNSRVLFSLQPVPYAQLDALVGSADIGIALYRDIGENVSQIGLSSGKLAQYLKCGLPVVTTDFPSLRQIIEGYRCGICVSDPQEVGQAVSEILECYDTYSTNSVVCYNELFAPEKHFDEVLERLAQIS